MNNKKEFNKNDIKISLSEDNGPEIDDGKKHYDLSSNEENYVFNDQSINVEGIDENSQETVYTTLLEKCETMSNTEFLYYMQRYSGFLNNNQKKEIITKYVKIDAEKSIKYKDINDKIRNEWYDENIKVRLDPNEPPNSFNNVRRMKLAALENSRLSAIEKAYREARKAEENVKEIEVDENNSMSIKGPVVNLKTAQKYRIIAKYRNGEVEIINPENNLNEQEKFNQYKQKIKLSQNDTEDDGEWCDSSSLLENNDE